MAGSEAVCISLHTIKILERNLTADYYYYTRLKLNLKWYYDENRIFPI